MLEISFHFLILYAITVTVEFLLPGLLPRDVVWILKEKFQIRFFLSNFNAIVNLIPRGIIFALFRLVVCLCVCDIFLVHTCNFALLLTHDIILFRHENCSKKIEHFSTKVFFLGQSLVRRSFHDFQFSQTEVPLSDIQHSLVAGRLR